VQTAEEPPAPQIPAPPPEPIVTPAGDAPPPPPDDAPQIVLRIPSPVAAASSGMPPGPGGPGLNVPPQYVLPTPAAVPVDPYAEPEVARTPVPTPDPLLAELPDPRYVDTGARVQLPDGRDAPAPPAIDYGDVVIGPINVESARARAQAVLQSTAQRATSDAQASAERAKRDHSLHGFLSGATSNLVDLAATSASYAADPRKAWDALATKGERDRAKDIAFATQGLGIVQDAVDRNDPVGGATRLLEPTLRYLQPGLGVAFDVAHGVLSDNPHEVGVAVAPVVTQGVLAAAGGAVGLVEDGLVAGAAQPEVPAGELGAGEAPLGGRGPSGFGDTIGRFSGRPFDAEATGGPILELEWRVAEITQEGIANVELHTSRFGAAPENEVMLDRLRGIADGTVTPTDYDLRFYTHELRELQRDEALGYPTGEPAQGAYEMWNDCHSATLEDFKINEKTEPLYHPDALDPPKKGK
jgi:hypothetical protein